MNPANVPALLDYLNPAALDYSDWLSVGMALQHEGFSVETWEAWSRRDTDRYKQGECERKWSGFHGSGSPVTVATICKLAKDQGYRPPPGREEDGYDWDDTIDFSGDKSAQPHKVVDQHWLQDAAEICEPGDNTWNPSGDLTKYLTTLFELDEHVGYVVETWEKDGKQLPTRGVADRTAGELIDCLKRYAQSNPVEWTVGDYKPEVGAWIRFNPLDGNGVRDENVTAYRYALVESDDLSIERQAAIISELELPVAALVHSGSRSLHAIVRVDADNYDEYRKRVDFLYEICQKNGLQLDRQNRNPSRLSRMPGVIRNGRKQFLLSTNTGKKSWDEWRDWIEDINDELPDPEPLADVFDNPPDLAKPLIADILREGHKMLLAGPSKAGKSYALIQLCIAVAEGREWFGWKCAQGRVLYVNLELDRASCLHRFKDVYAAHGWPPAHLQNIDIWNLRGNSVPMDKLAPKLIRRAAKKHYKAVIIDPIYKVITGDENSADQMAHFCNQFDRVCAELGAAVIYCHHHSKGSQGQKNSRDRSSGSGVFARDPDAIIDLIELIIDDSRRKQIENTEVCGAISTYLDKEHAGWREEISQDDALMEKHFMTAAQELLGGNHNIGLSQAVYPARKRAEHISGWRLEGTLREFPPFDARRLFFRYPIHTADELDMLKDAKADGEQAPWERDKKAKEQDKADRKTERLGALETAFEAQAMGESEVHIDRIAEHLEVSRKTAQRRISEHPEFVIENGKVRRKNDK